mmetsp:Transcript_22359/g.41901  ORF Transcript_22359/g.41901 Transcript_22359/m.41901 type:complete len:316 (+) Transcript_22359:1-948(+)
MLSSSDRALVLDDVDRMDFEAEETAAQARFAKVSRALVEAEGDQSRGGSRGQSNSHDSRSFGTARGIARGVLGLGQGVFGAATGIVSQPLSSGSDGSWGLSSILKGVGKGLVGVVTKPISGAADLIAQTSDGIMQDAGIGPASGPQLMCRRRALFSLPQPALRYNWKVLKGNDTFVHADRVAIHDVVVEVALTLNGILFSSVFAGRVPYDISTLATLSWAKIEALDENFKHPSALVITASGADEIVHSLCRLGLVQGEASSSALPSPNATQAPSCQLRFASKQDRRVFVKIAIALQRRRLRHVSSHPELLDRDQT